ncbi:MAG: 50S ribosomal protein L23 [Alphaproteobacteria bacterium]
MDPYRVIKRPLHNEKSVWDVENDNSYHFEVDLRASKHDIKEAIEKVFEVKVSRVRTMARPGKKRRARNRTVHTRGWKKAIVTLAQGDSIDLGY